MFARTLSTPNDGTLTLARLALAAVFFAHGAQKMLGWFGGHGFEGTMQYLTGVVHAPAPVAALAIVVEFFAPFALAAGLLTRPAALALSVFTLVAMSQHLANGFFMNWFGTQKGEGYEIHLLLLALLAALVVRGAGAFSLDGWLARRRAGGPAVAGPTGATAAPVPG